MHTQGKLYLDECDTIRQEDGERFRLCNAAISLNSTKSQDEPLANDRRLVALWNACDGIPTEALEADCVRKLVEATREELDIHAKNGGCYQFDCGPHGNCTCRYCRLHFALAPFQEGSR